MQVSILWVYCEHSGNISCSLLVKPSGTDESCAGQKMVCGYIRSEFIHWALWRTLMRTTFFYVCSPQVIWLSSAPGALSTLLTSVVLYSLTLTRLMSPGQDEIRLCRYIRSEFFHWSIWGTLMRTKYFFLCWPQVFCLSSAPDALIILVISVGLYSLTRATLMSPGQYQTRVCGYLRSEFNNWVFWRTLTREKIIICFFTIRIVAMLRTRYFGQSSDISCSLLVNLSHTDESGAGPNTCLWIFTLWIYLLGTTENTDWTKKFFVHSPQVYLLSLAQVLWALWWHQLFSTR